MTKVKNVDSESTTNTKFRYGLGLFISAFALCTLVTWALGLSNVKYKQHDLIAFENGFPGELEQWQRTGEKSNISVSNEKITINRTSPERSYAKRVFDLPVSNDDADIMLRVKGKVITESYVEDSSGDPGASLMIWIQDSSDEVLKYYNVDELSGRAETYQSQRIVSIPAGGTAVTLVLNSRDATSSFSLVDASIDTIIITPLYTGAVAILILSWLVIAGFSGPWLYKNLSTKSAIVALMLVGGIIVGVLMPEHITNTYIASSLQFISQHLLPSGYNAAAFVFKLGHFLFFFSISLLLFLNVNSLTTSKVNLLLLLLLLAIATEGMQLHLFDRSTRLLDLGIDSLGVLLALLLSFVFNTKKPVNEKTISTSL